MFNLAPPQGIQATGILASTITTAVTWSAAQTFSGQLFVSDGLVTAPSISRTGDDTGFYFAEGATRVAIDGTQVAFFGSGGIASASVFVGLSADIVFSRVAANVCGLGSGDSLSIGGAALATGTNVLQVLNGTAPSSMTADCVTFYSSDNTAGNTIPSFYCEGTGVVATGQSDSASSVRVLMRINGTVRTFLCI